MGMKTFHCQRMRVAHLIIAGVYMPVSHQRLALDASRLAIGRPGILKLIFAPANRELLGVIAVQALSVLGIAVILRNLAMHDAHWVLIVIAAYAILLCFVPLSVLLALVQRPLEELVATIARTRWDDLSARVEFAKRDDGIGQLWQQFNEMVERLAQNREENMHG
jgi:methyl-accepting chemotaxis protein